jgi:NAD(P)-dependent dehydrogenase (short-subunit alcohol dehydrogenase family)
VDLADESAVRAIEVRLGPRDVLVHAAAAFDRAGLAEIDSATSRHVQAVNVESALWLCQATAALTRARRRGRRGRFLASKAAGALTGQTCTPTAARCSPERGAFLS